MKGGKRKGKKDIKRGEEKGRIRRFKTGKNTTQGGGGKEEIHPIKKGE